LRCYLRNIWLQIIRFFASLALLKV
jgi:hypothetical protein